MDKKEDLRKDFICKSNKKKCSDLFSKVVKIGLDFKISKNKKSVINYKDQEKIFKDLIGPIPLNYTPLKKVIKEYEKKIVEAFIWNKELTGDFYLGYLDRPSDIKYLSELFQKILRILLKDKLAKKVDGKYILDNKFLEPFFVSSLVENFVKKSYKLGKSPYKEK